MKITTNEWIKALQEAEKENAEGNSMAEITEKMGCSSCTTVKRIKKMIKEGKVVCVGKRKSISISGDICQVPIYKLIKKH